MIDVQHLEELIAAGEAITREFKSDRRQISDDAIYGEVVAMANTEGGVLLIGVEDDGSVSGAKPRHGATTEPRKLQAAIFNNTVPSINTRISVIPHVRGSVLAIEVDPYPEPCAMASGRSMRRTIGADGKPQTVPFYPRDQRSRRIDLGLLDFSAQVVEGVCFGDLNPLEFERVRQAIVTLRGDRKLVQLSDEELAKALRLVESRGRALAPNIAGLLLLARDKVLESVVPTHDIRFQVIDGQGEVKVNDSLRAPILRALEEVQSRFAARNEEREAPVGLFRVPVPDYSAQGFREAINNAILHRDYSQVGPVYVQWHPDHMLIANAGGFPEGITPDNILTHEPKPRNPRLFDACRRVGLIEQTGRGVDRIYMGQLRYGRPAPDYSRSDSQGVRVILHGGRPSLQFAAFVYEEERANRPLPLDHLMILNKLFLERRIHSEAAGSLIQKGTPEGRAVLEQLHERSLVEAKGERRGRVYHLSAKLYRRLGRPEAYVRTHDIDRVRQEGLVIEYIQAHGGITAGELMALLGVSRGQVRRIIDRMKVSGKLKPRGNPPRGAYYVIK